MPVRSVKFRRRALAAAAVVIACAGPADAGNTFGVSVVHGVRVVAVAQGQAHDVWSDPRFFPETCAGLDQARPRLQDLAAQMIEQKLDAQLPHGFSVSRVKVALEPLDCETSGRMPGIATIGFDYRFARSTLTFSLNTTQDGVPRLDFAANFDLSIRADLVLPSHPPFQLGLDHTHLSVQNIAYDSENAPADIVKGAVDALHALTGFDAMAGVTQDRAFDLGPVEAGIGRLQAALPAGASLQVTRHDDQAVIMVGDGSSLSDPRCISGYVWRQAGPNDLVCVTPAVRAQTAAENRDWPTHVVSQTVTTCATYICRMNGGHTASVLPQKYPCRIGFVYREAFAGDYVCVTPAAHAQALSDNQYELVRRVDYRAPIK